MCSKSTQIEEKIPPTFSLSFKLQKGTVFVGFQVGFPSSPNSSSCLELLSSCMCSKPTQIEEKIPPAFSPSFKLQKGTVFVGFQLGFPSSPNSSSCLELLKVSNGYLSSNLVFIGPSRASYHTCMDSFEELHYFSKFCGFLKWVLP